MRREIKLEGFSTFNFKLSHGKHTKETHVYQIEAHTHEELEIYVNVSGDISFMVENKIYDVERGNIIIAKPNEQHHCIYRSNAEHEFFWILIPINRELLKPILQNNNKNLIVLSSEEGEELIEICKKLSEQSFLEYEKYILFFKLLEFLQKGKHYSEKFSEDSIPKDIIFALEYINNNLNQEIKIKDIANASFVSINTLERHFKERFNQSPNEFIRKRRLFLATVLLREGKSVQESAMESGFCDSAHFIYLFKKEFGITPLKYQKQLKNKG